MWMGGAQTACCRHEHSGDPTVSFTIMHAVSSQELEATARQRMRSAQHLSAARPHTTLAQLGLQGDADKAVWESLPQNFLDSASTSTCTPRSWLDTSSSGSGLSDFGVPCSNRREGFAALRPLEIEASSSFEQLRQSATANGWLDAPEGAALLERIGRAKQMSGDLNGAFKQFQEAQQILEAADLLKSRDGARLLMRTGSVYFELGLHEEATCVYKQALLYLREDNLMESVDGAALITYIGIANHRLGELQSGTRCFVKASQIFNRLGLFQTYEGVTLLRSIGDARYSGSDFVGAMEAYADARQILENIGGHKTVEDAMLLTSVGITQQAQGILHYALDHYQRALSIFRSSAGAGSVHHAGLLATLGVARGLFGDWSGAEEAFKGALEIREQTGTLETLDGVKLLKQYGSNLSSRGEPRKAFATFERAHAILERRGESHMPQVAELQDLMQHVTSLENEERSGNLCWDDRPVGAGCHAVTSDVDLLMKIGKSRHAKGDTAGGLEAMMQAHGILDGARMLSTPYGLQLQKAMRTLREEGSSPQPGSPRAAASGGALGSCALGEAVGETGDQAGPQRDGRQRPPEAERDRVQTVEVSSSPPGPQAPLPRPAPAARQTRQQQMQQREGASSQRKARSLTPSSWLRRLPGAAGRVAASVGPKEDRRRRASQAPTCRKRCTESCGAKARAVARHGG